MTDSHAFRRSHDIVIEAEPAAVYDYVTNPMSWPEWIAASHEMHSPDRPLTAGETFHEDWHTRTGPAVLNWLVLESARPHRWIAETQTDFTGVIIAQYDFEAVGDGCRYTRTLINPARPKPPTEEMIQRIDDEAGISLENIKRNVEAGGRPFNRDSATPD